MQDVTAEPIAEPIDELVGYMVINQNIGPTLESAEGAVVRDEGGAEFIDLEAGPGVSSVGHCHPAVVEAIKAQADRMLHVPGRYHSRLTLRLAKRIADYAGGTLKRTFFANSGTEASDGSIKCAMKHAVNKGKKGFGIIALQHGFHGRLSLPLALTGIARQKRGFGPYGTFPGVVHAPAPYCYRCPFGEAKGTCGLKCADAVEDILHTSIQGEAAVMIAEPILGVGGVIVPPDGYWKRVEEICRRHDITLIHDEVFTGFGRTGKNFAHHHYGTSPDIVGFAKAIGGGVPLGGFIATEELGTAFAPADHFTTYGAKNQIGIAAGHAVLDVLADGTLARHAETVGEFLLEGLKALRRKHMILGDVRGKGLMIGMEIVRDERRTPGPDLAKAMEREMLARRVLVSTTGAYGNVLRATPPLVIDRAQVEAVLKAIDESLTAIAA